MRDASNDPTRGISGSSPTEPCYLPNKAIQKPKT